jgi:hypothetical protein
MPVQRKPAANMPVQRKPAANMPFPVLQRPAAAVSSLRGATAEEQVYSKLMERLQAEVDGEKSRLSPGNGESARSPRGCQHLCKFCPFRRFQRAGQLRAHLDKFHTKERLFSANARSEAQFKIACAIYDQEQAKETVSPTLTRLPILETSASLIRQWVDPSPEVLRYLQKQNDIDLVMKLTGGGPTYVLKHQTGDCVRLNQNVYYDHRFANDILALSIYHRGRLQNVFQSLTSKWVSAGCQCAFIAPRRSPTWSDLAEDVINSTTAKSLKTQLIDQCTVHNEWRIANHDATFQSLFSIIGQTKMAQLPNEKHAVHSFTGMTGAVPGLSLQHTESKECFKKASLEVLPEAARQTTEYLFSDSPDNVERSTDVFPALKAVAEDGAHLVFRVEACFGEHRCALSREVMKLQLKFRVPRPGDMYRGIITDDADVGAWDLGNLPDVSVSEGRDWDAYMTTPYDSHQDYVNDLMDLVGLFPDDMKRSNSKGRTVQQILESGASYHHFRYLLNGSHIRATLSAQENALMAWATCGNEAIHQQLNAHQRTTLQQHAEGAQFKLDAFVLGKLITHNVAAYHPTCVQRDHAELLPVVISILQQQCFQPFGVNPVDVEGFSRAAMRSPSVAVDSDRVDAQHAKQGRQAAAWAKEKEKRATRKTVRRGIASDARSHGKKRTVYTKKKELRPKRSKSVGGGRKVSRSNAKK